MRGEASRVNNECGYLSESLMCSCKNARFVLNRLMKQEEVQETKLE